MSRTAAHFQTQSEMPIRLYGTVGAHPSNRYTAVVANPDSISQSVGERVLSMNTVLLSIARAHPRPVNSTAFNSNPTEVTVLVRAVLVVFE